MFKGKKDTATVAKKVYYLCGSIVKFCTHNSSFVDW